MPPKPKQKRNLHGSDEEDDNNSDYSEPQRPKREKISVPVHSDAESTISTMSHSPPPSQPTIQAYHLNLKPCDGKCKNTKLNNPFCTCCVAGKKSGIFSKDSELFKDVGDDPAEYMRKSGQFAGLENLGATCYANTLLQCLYMNERFRSCVYAYKGTREPILELQRLFADLQFGPKSFACPRKLMEQFQIKVSIQQDIQEFFQLLMSYLEGDDQSLAEDPELVQLSNFVKENFRGESRAIITCVVCGHSNLNSVTTQTFHDFRIQSANRLEDCIQELVKPESLTMSNRWQCQKCAKKQDATLQQTFVKLPKMMHLQVMRYQYSVENQTRKKVRDRLVFPEALDMSPFVSDDYQLPTQYHLSAVLLHSGMSAYAGHYVTQIRDERSGHWYHFNDKDVKAITPSQVGAVDPSRARKEEEPGLHASTAVYMFVYTLDEPIQTPPPQPPSHLQQVLKDIKEQYEQEAKEYHSKSEVLQHEIDQKRTSVTKVLQTMKDHRASLKHMFFWVPLEFLRKALAGEPAPFDVTSLQCPHGYADPKKLTEMRAISVETWNALVSELGVSNAQAPLSSDMLCDTCSQEVVNESESKAAVSEERKNIANIIARNGDQSGYYVNKQWLAAWKKGENDPAHDPTYKVLCEHGNLTIDTRSLALVPTEAWSYFVSKYHPQTEKSSHDQPCAECRHVMDDQAERDKVQAKRRLEEKKKLDKLYKGAKVTKTGSYHAIPSKWVELWKSYIDHPEVYERPGPIDFSEIMCPHNMLLYEPENEAITLVGGETEEKYPPENEPVVLQCNLLEVKPEHKWELLPDICTSCAEVVEETKRMKRRNYVNGTLQVSKVQGTRSRQVTSRRGGSANVRISSTDTLGDLRLRIYQALEIDPLSQRIMCNGRVLSGESTTLFDLGVENNARLDVSIVDDNDEDMFVTGETEGHGMAEEGFAGSLFAARPPSSSVTTTTTSSNSKSNGIGGGGVVTSSRDVVQIPDDAESSPSSPTSIRSGRESPVLRGGATPVPPPNCRTVSPVPQSPKQQAAIVPCSPRLPNAQMSQSVPFRMLSSPALTTMPAPTPAAFVEFNHRPNRRGPPPAPFPAANTILSVTMQPLDQASASTGPLHPRVEALAGRRRSHYEMSYEDSAGVAPPSMPPTSRRHSNPRSDVDSLSAEVPEPIGMDTPEITERPVPSQTPSIEPFFLNSAYPELLNMFETLRDQQRLLSQEILKTRRTAEEALRHCQVLEQQKQECEEQLHAIEQHVQTILRRERQ